jgi:hypothetical protein
MTKKKDPKDLQKVGAKPFFDNPEDLKLKIDEYFANPPKRAESIGGEAVEIPFVSITGLVLHCGFSDRASFYDYEKKPEFTHIIKQARTHIESEYEYILQRGKNQTGAIFALKTMKWDDRASEQGKEDKPINIVINNPHGD